VFECELWLLPSPIVHRVLAADTGGGRNDPATFEWPALLRKLDRIDASYKQ
jgi:hypothetical protein